jgi:hypothetical protein
MGFWDDLRERITRPFREEHAATPEIAEGTAHAAPDLHSKQAVTEGEARSALLQTELEQRDKERAEDYGNDIEDGRLHDPQAFLEIDTDKEEQIQLEADLDEEELAHKAAFEEHKADMEALTGRPYDDQIQMLYREPWSMDSDGETETRILVGKSSDGYHAGFDSSYRGMEQDRVWGDGLPSYEEALDEARKMEREENNIDDQLGVAVHPMPELSRPLESIDGPMPLTNGAFLWMDLGKSEEGYHHRLGEDRTHITDREVVTYLPGEWSVAYSTEQEARDDGHRAMDQRFFEDTGKTPLEQWALDIAKLPEPFGQYHNPAMRVVEQNARWIGQSADGYHYQHFDEHAELGKGKDSVWSNAYPTLGDARAAMEINVDACRENSTANVQAFYERQVEQPLKIEEVERLAGPLQFTEGKDFSSALIEPGNSGSLTKDASAPQRESDVLPHMDTWSSEAQRMIAVDLASGIHPDQIVENWTTWNPDRGDAAFYSGLVRSTMNQEQRDQWAPNTMITPAAVENNMERPEASHTR